MSRLLFAVFGSAGDVFPSIAVALEGQANGHDVLLLAPRSAALYGRSARLPTLAIGDGSELGALTDKHLYTRRFDGFASWRRTADRYGYSLLAEGYDRVLAAVRKYKPDLVVAHPLATFGSLFADELRIPWVSLHLYPQLVPTVDRDQRATRSLFGGRLAKAVRDLEISRGLPNSHSPIKDRGWSSQANISVHDPALVERTCLAGMRIGDPCGFPYWDAIPVVNGDAEIVAGLRRSSTTTVVVTLGSFIGQTQPEFWQHIASSIGALGWRGVLVGAPNEMRNELEGRGDNVCVGYAPLSSVFRFADIAVHHGGIGTTYAALLAGVPAVVLPHAFDQAFNARMLADAGLGANAGSAAEVSVLLRRLAGDDRAADACQSLMSELTQPKDAAIAIAARLIREVGGS